MEETYLGNCIVSTTEPNLLIIDTVESDVITAIKSLLVFDHVHEFTIVDDLGLRQFDNNYVSKINYLSVKVTYKKKQYIFM